MIDLQRVKRKVASMDGGVDDAPCVSQSVDIAQLAFIVRCDRPIRDPGDEKRAGIAPGSVLIIDSLFMFWGSGRSGIS